MQAIIPLLVVLHHMHEAALVHRSVTPDAILFGADSSARIGSFHRVLDMSHSEPTSLVGCLEHIAPDMLLCESFNSDPFHHKSQQLTYDEKVRGPAAVCKPSSKRQTSSKGQTTSVI